MPFPDKGAVLIEFSGRIAFASTYFCDLVGIEHDKIAGMSFFDFVYPEDMNEARKMFKPTKISTADPSSLRLRRIDGGLVWVEIHGAPMEDAHGDAYAISATVTAAAQAITGQKTTPRSRGRNRKFKARLRSRTESKTYRDRARWLSRVQVLLMKSRNLVHSTGDFLYFVAVLALAAVLAASPIVLLHSVQKTIPS